MKRSRVGGELGSITTMANYLVLLSRGGEVESATHSPDQVFECKTCKRQFMSFQALGGHSASHKKHRLTGDNTSSRFLSTGSQAKAETHECSVCGLEFAIGQALGGHMRRHKAPVNENSSPLSLFPTAPVLKRSNSKRVFCLDLNLPPQENDLEFRPGKVAPLLHCY